MDPKLETPNSKPETPNSPIPRSEFRAPQSPDNSKPEIPNSKPETPNPKLTLESAIAVRLKSKTELSDLAKLLAKKSARQDALETTGDLHNAAVLSEIGRLQIFTALLPRRIAAQEQADLKAEQTLIDATNQFIRGHLGPRVRQLAARTRAIVEAELSPHFPDPAALILAVAGSERVRHIEALAWSSSIAPAHGAMEHAQGALQSWSAADQFENELANSDSGGARLPASRP